ncbi:uncharacterized protein APUU_71068S [Aspergillus puulaauensis]|uniref:Uncharacterized protein n=1 Tax=Aspergillus puulaauensis TaxID=1220207 RepID=A0A7R8AU31_9EURO|nr:uncharacterized protein APUU_71068S [Aspergillus puulaauensis]BCS29498.1 hypothetical protein APUU_71068S [Aspergillus puulaauensis]
MSTATAPVNMPLYIAIHSNPGIKHWSLFIDAPNPSDKTTAHVLGARQRYFPQISTRSDARTSPSLVELCPVCEISVELVEAVKRIAWDTRIRNEERDYSCQDYVLDVLGRLEGEGIVDARDGGYLRNKDVIMGKRESWINT